MIGRNDKEWGQIGAITIAGTLGWTIDAPAAAEYAVLPVGVDIIRPTIASRQSILHKALHLSMLEITISGDMSLSQDRNEYFITCITIITMGTPAQNHMHKN